MEYTVDQSIAGSYGTEDNVFAGHPSDRARAREALKIANAEEIGFDEYVQKHRDYLKGRGCSNEHIEKQIARVTNLESYFDFD